MARKRRKPLSENELEAIKRLFTYGVGFGRSAECTPIADWAIALARGQVKQEDVNALERYGVRVEKEGRHHYVLTLSNRLLKERDREINQGGKRFNRLLRRVGGRAVGTVRFAGQPHRATRIPWRLVWQYADRNRYNPQFRHEPQMPTPHQWGGWMPLIAVPASYWDGGLS